MKLNKEKCHFLVAGHKYEHFFVDIGNQVLWEESNVKLLGIDINQDLNSDKFVRTICNKAERKLSALIRIIDLLNTKQRRVLVKAFIESQFNYNPLVWVFYNRETQKRINSLHERALRMIYNDKNSNFEKLLEKDKSVSIHHRNLQALAVEMYKVKNDIASSSITSLFPKRKTKRTLRNSPNFYFENKTSEKYGIKSISYLGCKIWELVPNDLKASSNLKMFKNKIKNWIPKDCKCRLCKTYVQGVGFF